MDKKTLIVLYKPGVCVAKIANYKAMDYITSIGPKLSEGAVDEAIPETVLHGFEESYPIGDVTVKIRPLQCADDRANAIPGTVFSTQSEAMAYARNNGIVLAFCYRGTLAESGR